MSVKIDFLTKKKPNILGFVYKKNNLSHLHTKGGATELATLYPLLDFIKHTQYIFIRTSKRVGPLAQLSNSVQ